LLFFRRKKGNFKTRATIGGVAIAVTALYALTVSYDITVRELAGYLLGSVVVLLGAMLAAIALVLVYKALKWLISRAVGKLTREGESGGHE
jgi:hypothetical protein